jgi:hypothetical protein
VPLGPSLAFVVGFDGKNREKLVGVMLRRRSSGKGLGLSTVSAGVGSLVNIFQHGSRRACRAPWLRAKRAGFDSKTLPRVSHWKSLLTATNEPCCVLNEIGFPLGNRRWKRCRSYASTMGFVTWVGFVIDLAAHHSMNWPRRYERCSTVCRESPLTSRDRRNRSVQT